MKVQCPRCGVLEETRWIWSGLCVDCFLSPETWIEPSTVVAGADLGRAECALCGVLVDHGELCRSCDDDVTRAYDRVFHS